jgi:hypothetical protein
VRPQGRQGSNPSPSALAPMVKRISCLASNEAFRVQILVGVLLGAQGNRILFPGKTAEKLQQDVLIPTGKQSFAA